MTVRQRCWQCSCLAFSCDLNKDYSRLLWISVALPSAAPAAQLNSVLLLKTKEQVKQTGRFSLYVRGPTKKKTKTHSQTAFIPQHTPVTDVPHSNLNAVNVTGDYKWLQRRQFCTFFCCCRTSVFRCGHVLPLCSSAWPHFAPRLLLVWNFVVSLSSAANPH